MRYLGGKSRIAKPLTAYLLGRLGSRKFVEPFCGGLSITTKMPGPRLAADGNEALINLYLALRGGWAPPATLSEAEYKHLRATQDPADPMTAFAGIGCSFGGRWYQGLTRPSASDPDRDYVGAAGAGLRRDLALCKEVTFAAVPYHHWQCDARHLVYCDPPYEGTKGYEGVGRFDSASFWVRAREWARLGALVLVSEYKAPPDIPCVWSIETKTDMRGTEGQLRRTERLFEVPGG